MIVQLIADTRIQPAWVFKEVIGYKPQSEGDRWACTDADDLAEAAGRLCYKSFDRPNPKTASNSGYLQNIIDHRHFSVLEHASASFYISGVSRSLTHELIRHRHFSYSQVSQRYVDESGAHHILPNGFTKLSIETRDRFLKNWMEALDLYRTIYNELRAKGYDKKAARGSARSVLPNMTETSLIVTGNHRAFREFIEKRSSSGADVEIRDLSILLLIQLKKIAPNTYQDMEL